MSTELWVAVISIGLGTFALRLFPLLWMRHYVEKHADKEALDAIPHWLSILGPLMIAAMLGVSLVPSQQGFLPWLMIMFGCLATTMTWKYTRSIGLPVCAGVLLFGILQLVFY